MLAIRIKYAILLIGFPAALAISMWYFGSLDWLVRINVQLITIYSIQSASALPTMIFIVSLPNNNLILSSEKHAENFHEIADSFHKFLEYVLRYLIVLLVASMLAAGIIVLVLIFPDKRIIHCFAVFFGTYATIVFFFLPWIFLHILKIKIRLVESNIN